MKRVVLLGWLLGALALGGCGGGGATEGAAAPSDPVVLPVVPPVAPPVVSAPTIVTQPAPVSAGVGATATFDVLATGSGPIAYQWRRDEVAIPGATSASFTTSALALADGGARFSVVVSNAGGSVTSIAAVLTVAAPVGPAPRIEASPADLAVVAGGRATLRASHEGVARAYRWTRDGVVLPGETGATLVITPATSALDGARHAVTVTTDAGEQTSPELRLAVRTASLAVPRVRNAHFAVADGTGSTWSWTFTGTGLYAGTGAALPGTTIRNLTLDQVRQLSVHADHGLALRQDGTVWAWGSDDNRGRLGQGTRDSNLNINPPRIVTGADRVVEVTAGVYASYALRDDGTVLRWGERAEDSAPGQVFHDSRPVVWTALSGVRRIHVGALGLSEYALMRDGTVMAWGWNDRGQLGDGTTTGANGTTGRNTPRRVLDIDGVVALAATDGAAIAVRNDGTAWSWGTGLLGYGDLRTERRLRPSAIPGIVDAIDVWASSTAVVVKRRDGSLLVWGNLAQDLGAPDGLGLRTVATPVPVVGIDDAVTVGLNGSFAIVLLSDGRLVTWGNNGGQTGGDVFTGSPVFRLPTPVLALDLAR